MRLCRLEHTFVHGDGVWLTDADGRRYLDAYAQYGAVALGHAAPEVTAAVRAALDARTPAMVQPYLAAQAEALGEALAAVAPGHPRRCVFASSGAEAVEAALKLVRARTGRSLVLAATGAYHGKTLGALSLTGRAEHAEGFGPLAPGFDHVPFGDADGAGGAARARARPDRGAVPRADPGRRGRDRAARRLPRAGARALQPPRRRAGPRRDPDRARADGTAVRLRGGRGGARRAADRQGAGRRAVPARRLPRRRRLVGRTLRARPLVDVRQQQRRLRRWGWRCCARWRATATVRVWWRARRRAASASAPGCGVSRRATRGWWRRRAGAACSGRSQLRPADEAQGLLLGYLQHQGLYAYAAAAVLAEQSSVLALPTLGTANVLRIAPPLVVSDEEIDLIVDGVESMCGKLARNPCETIVRNMGWLRPGRPDDAAPGRPRAAAAADAGADAAAARVRARRPQALGVPGPLHPSRGRAGDGAGPRASLRRGARVVLRTRRRAAGRPLPADAGRAIARDRRRGGRAHHRPAAARRGDAAPRAPRDGARRSAAPSISRWRLGRRRGRPGRVHERRCPIAGRRSPAAACRSRPATRSPPRPPSRRRARRRRRAASRSPTRASRCWARGDRSARSMARLAARERPARALADRKSAGRSGAARGAGPQLGAAARRPRHHRRRRCVAGCDLVLSATGAARPVLDALPISPGTIVCDVARPPDAGPAVRGRADVTVIDGGLIALPDPRLTFGPGNLQGLPPGIALACLSETILHALEGTRVDLRRGRRGSARRRRTSRWRSAGVTASG